MKSLWIGVWFLAWGLAVQAQVALPAEPALQAPYAQEDQDWGVEPPSRLRTKGYHAPTPGSIPGARVIRTLQLKALLDSGSPVTVVDVLNVVRDKPGRQSLPGAVWLPGAGRGDFYAAEKSRLAKALEAATAGDRSRPVVFLCLSAQCWLSYNAAVHAVEAGYTDVLWYRGGTEAWAGAALPLAELAATPW